MKQRNLKEIRDSAMGLSGGRVSQAAEASRIKTLRSECDSL